jgi:N-carbamoylputrescine amidase
MKDIRVATAMMQSEINKTNQNMTVMHDFICMAKKSGAQILCFPELNMTGYCNQSMIREVAEPVPGPSVNKLLAFARDYKMVILSGLAEINQEQLYITHLIAFPNGYLGIYRKLYLAPPEKKIFACGHTAPVFQMSDLSLGIQLCYDAHFPELTTLMNASGTEIIFIPHASPHGTSEQKFNSWMRHLPARAYDNSIFIVACNASGQNCAGLTFPALALALDPSGNLINKSYTQDELMVVDLKESAFDYVRKHEMRYFFANRREYGVEPSQPIVIHNYSF